MTTLTRDDIARVIREHVRCDATGLNPHIAGLYLTGFYEAADAVLAALGQPPAEPKLSEREREIYAVLDDKFERPHRIAVKAKIRTTSPAETASTYCIRLVKKGLAEKGGSPMFPEWRRAQPPTA